MSDDFRNDPILGRAFDYWDGKRAGRAMPRRRDIAPVEIPRLLPHLVINEFVDAGARIKLRLVGTAIVATYGADYTGKFFDEVFGGERLHYLEEKYRLMSRERRPIFMITRYVSRRNVDLVCRRIVLPLSDNDRDVNQALAAMSFQFPGEPSAVTAGQWTSEFDPAYASCEVIR